MEIGFNRFWGNVDPNYRIVQKETRSCAKKSLIVGLAFLVASIAMGIWGIVLCSKNSVAGGVILMLVSLPLGYLSYHLSCACGSTYITS